MLLLISRPDGHPARITVEPGENLAQAVWLSGKVPPAPLCGGLGLCGRCRARFASIPPEPAPADYSFFSEAELALGWRLLCRHFAGEIPGEAALELPPGFGKIKKHWPDACADEVFLGVDFGTTSVQWRAENSLGEAVSEGAMPNPQAGAGADVMSRALYASTPEGLARLAALSRDALGGIIRPLQAGGRTVGRVCAAGNSIMTSILLEQEMGGFLAAPYESAYKGGEALACSFPEMAGVELLIPPLPAPFVGGDVSAGLLAVLERGAKAPFLLADMGTNGEFALCDETGRLFLTSVPLGPALEGIGPAKGMAAGPGAAVGFRLTPGGLEAIPYDDSATAVGISATGYISLLARLRQAGVLDEKGHFQEAPLMPLSRLIASGLCEERGEPALELPGGIYLTANDVELLLKIKAAFSVALRMLLGAAGLRAGQIRSLQIAGALGTHANPADLAALGFIPQALVARVCGAGNASLAGACLLARQPEKLEYLRHLCAEAVVVDLANDGLFEREYIDAMRWL